jgi:hypothetical protein
VVADGPTKLLPLQVAGDENNPVAMIHRIERVIVQQPARHDERSVKPERKLSESPAPKSNKHWSV